MLYLAPQKHMLRGPQAWKKDCTCMEIDPSVRLDCLERLTLNQPREYLKVRLEN